MGGSVLHQLARKGDLDLAAQYLDQGANIHARDDDLNSTPLSWAAKHGQIEMVKFLLQQGALKVHPNDPAWATPAAWAKRRHFAVILELLEE